jgi:riboflavin kinase/FMN adenylyltransferase
MKIIHGISQINKFKKPVVALGVFDGVHRGHRIILKAAVKKAREIKGRSLVLTFSPHPQKEESLYSLEHRLRLIAETGIDVCIVVNFSRKFAKISAEQFIKDILVKKIGAQYIYVGRNFRFGKNAGGDSQTLARFAKIYHFKLKLFNVLKINKLPISSTLIRALIKKGNLSTAQKLLSRPVSVLGTVIRGSSLAAKLGFPTANINPHHEVIPPSGVYAVKAIFNKNKYNGVCNIGTRPTFVKGGDRQVEVYIFNFKKNIYGKYLEIQFMKKIREERKFVSARVLAKQIEKDIETVCRLFSCH